MRKLFYTAALFAATMIGFTSCDKDDDGSNADIKKTAVGDYTIKTDFILSDGKTLSPFSDKDYPAAPGKIVSTDEGLQMQSEGDAISLINIAESSNGFTCDVKSIVVNDTDDNGQAISYTVTGFKGYEMKYDGGYNSSNKTLEFYLDWPMDKEALGWCALLLSGNEEVMTKVTKLTAENDDAGVKALVEELGAKYKYVVKYTCVKK